MLHLLPCRGQCLVDALVNAAPILGVVDIHKLCAEYVAAGPYLICKSPNLQRAPLQWVCADLTVPADHVRFVLPASEAKRRGDFYKRFKLTHKQHGIHALQSPGLLGAWSRVHEGQNVWLHEGRDVSLFAKQFAQQSVAYTKFKVVRVASLPISYERNCSALSNYGSASRENRAFASFVVTVQSCNAETAILSTFDLSLQTHVVKEERQGDGRHEFYFTPRSAPYLMGTCPCTWVYGEDE